MKTIPIPGGRDQKSHDDCVDYGDDLFLDFQEKGSFLRDKGGDAFSPKLPNGNVPAKKLGPFQAPAHNEVVHWTFDSSVTGKKTKGTITVKKDATCRDK